MKILYPIKKRDIIEISEYNLYIKDGIKFEYIYIDDYVQIDDLKIEELEENLKRKTNGFHNLYNKIQENINKYDVLWIRHGSLFHPKFINDINIFKCLHTTDDPEGSERDSKRYCKYYDLVIYAGIFYNQHERLEDKLKEWGAKETYWMPLGVYERKYRKKLNVDEIINNEKNKNIPIIFIGSSWLKEKFLIQVKKYFKKDFHIYGHWGGKRGIFKRIIKYNVWTYIKPLEEEKFLDILENSKIGINKHLSYGPSNQRMHILPANNVLQITDLPNQTKEIYDIDKEIICYEDLEEIIEKIEYYLHYEERRIEIILEANKKVMNNYLFEKNLKDCIKHIQKLIDKDNG